MAFLTYRKTKHPLLQKQFQYPIKFKQRFGNAKNNIFLRSQILASSFWNIMIQKSTILFLFIAVLILPFTCYAQVPENFDEYVLDTVLRPSTSNPAVMDTIIVARKKKIKKQAKPKTAQKKEKDKKQKHSTPTTTYQTNNNFYISPFIGLNSPLNKTAVHSETNHTTHTSFSPSTSFGVAARKNIGTHFSISVACAINKSSISQHAKIYENSITEKQFFIADTNEVYEQEIDGEITYKYLIDYIPTTETFIQIDTATPSNNTHIQSILFDAGIGIRHTLGRLTFFPEIIFGIQKNSFKEESTETNRISINTYSYKAGVSYTTTIEITSSIGFILCPELTLSTHYRSGALLLKTGIFYKM